MFNRTDKHNYTELTEQTIEKDGMVRTDKEEQHLQNIPDTRVEASKTTDKETTDRTEQRKQTEKVESTVQIVRTDRTSRIDRNNRTGRVREQKKQSKENIHD